MATWPTSIVPIFLQGNMKWFKYLANLCSTLNPNLWIIGGDFNLILSLKREAGRSHAPGARSRGASNLHRGLQSGEDRHLVDFIPGTTGGEVLPRYLVCLIYSWWPGNGEQAAAILQLRSSPQQAQITGRSLYQVAPLVSLSNVLFDLNNIG